MDLGRLRIGEWLTGAAGILLAVSLFLDWYTGRTAWESFAAVDVFLAIAALAAIGLPIVAAIERSTALPTGVAPIVTILAMIATVLVLLRLLQFPDVADGASREVGLYLGLAAAAGMIVTAWMSMRDERIPKPSGVRSAADVEVLPAPGEGTEAAGRA